MEQEANFNCANCFREKLKKVTSPRAVLAFCVAAICIGSAAAVLSNRNLCEPVSTAINSSANVDLDLEPYTGSPFGYRG